MLPASPAGCGGGMGGELPPFILAESLPPLHVTLHDGGAPPDAQPLHNNGSGGYGLGASTRRAGAVSPTLCDEAGCNM